MLIMAQDRRTIFDTTGGSLQIVEVESAVFIRGYHETSENSSYWMTLGKYATVAHAMEVLDRICKSCYNSKTAFYMPKEQQCSNSKQQLKSSETA